MMILLIGASVVDEDEKVALASIEEALSSVSSKRSFNKDGGDSDEEQVQAKQQKKSNKIAKGKKMMTLFRPRWRKN